MEQPFPRVLLARAEGSVCRQHEKPGLASEVSGAFRLERAVMWSANVGLIFRAVTYGSGKGTAGKGTAPVVLAAPLSAYAVAPDRSQAIVN